jgi:hypothetical protein
MQRNQRYFLEIAGTKKVYILIEVTVFLRLSSWDITQNIFQHPFDPPVYLNRILHYFS